MLRPLVLAACLPLLVPSVWSQNCPPGTAPVPTSPVHIRGIVFTNAALLSAEKQREISSKLREEAASAIDGSPEEVSLSDEDRGATNLADETAERVRADYQDMGYFRVEVSGKARRVTKDPLPRYDVKVRIVELGRQYRLGDLNILNAAHFPTQQLRSLFPIQRGEIFSRANIAAGLEALRRLYGSDGYINAIPVPNTQFDDEQATINLTIDVDEGKQFRLRSVVILGLDSGAKEQVLGELAAKPGDVYTALLWENEVRRFTNTNLGRVGSGSVEKKLDEQNGWVDVVLDFRRPRPCFPEQQVPVPASDNF